MIETIIFIIMFALFMFFICVAAYNESDFLAIIAAVLFICAVIGFAITTEYFHNEKDIQYQQNILELKLLEQRIELFDLQIEQLKLNINNK